MVTSEKPEYRGLGSNLVGGPAGRTVPVKSLLKAAMLDFGLQSWKVPWRPPA